MDTVSANGPALTFPSTIHSLQQSWPGHRKLHPDRHQPSPPRSPRFLFQIHCATQAEQSSPKQRRRIFEFDEKLLLSVQRCSARCGLTKLNCFGYQRRTERPLIIIQMVMRRIESKYSLREHERSAVTQQERKKRQTRIMASVPSHKSDKGR